MSTNHKLSRYCGTIQYNAERLVRRRKTNKQTKGVSLTPLTRGPLCQSTGNRVKPGGKLNWLPPDQEGNSTGLRRTRRETPLAAPSPQSVSRHRPIHHSLSCTALPHLPPAVHHLLRPSPGVLLPPVHVTSSLYPLGPQILLLLF